MNEELQVKQQLIKQWANATPEDYPNHAQWMQTDLEGLSVSCAKICAIEYHWMMERSIKKPCEGSFYEWFKQLENVRIDAIFNVAEQAKNQKIMRYQHSNPYEFKRHCDQYDRLNPQFEPHQREHLRCCAQGCPKIGTICSNAQGEKWLCQYHYFKSQ